MKRVFIFLILLTAVGAFYFLFRNRFDFSFFAKALKDRSKHRIKSELNTSSNSATIRKPAKVSLSKSIFVPYWSLTEDLEDGSYNRYIYFGITAGYQGIDKWETGYSKLDQFVKATEGKKTLLTLRLLNDDFNKDLLENESLQTKIIEETMMIVIEKKFSGVVLDLELFSLFDNGIRGQINNFVKRFYTVAKSNYRSFAVTVYGDVFFRKRPFDLPYISKNSDEILVMAYDFHKSRGEPGPNFPLARRIPTKSGEGGPETQTYDYDFKTMTTDYLKIVPAEKLTIIFGMFGYDWSVDEKKRPFAPGKALTYNEINDKFISKCEWKNCVVKRDESSAETEINYAISSDKPDEQNFYRIDYHIVWFEDEQSVKVKTDYLLKKGIDNIGYWAYGYF